jgi:hypothetical protein
MRFRLRFRQLPNIAAVVLLKCWAAAQQTVNSLKSMKKVKIIVATQHKMASFRNTTPVLQPDVTDLPVTHPVARGASRAAGKPASGSHLIIANGIATVAPEPSFPYMSANFSRHFRRDARHGSPIHLSHV